MRPARKNLVHPQFRQLVDFRRAVKFKFKVDKVKYLFDNLPGNITALNSSGVNSCSICCLIGTIISRKKGNAKEKADDFTTHSVTSEHT